MLPCATIEQILAEYFDIDLDVIAKEKDAMVEELYRANDKLYRANERIDP
jgi:hypothetical protein